MASSVKQEFPLMEHVAYQKELKLTFSSLNHLINHPRFPEEAKEQTLYRLKELERDLNELIKTKP